MASPIKKCLKKYQVVARIKRFKKINKFWHGGRWIQIFFWKTFLPVECRLPKETSLSIWETFQRFDTLWKIGR